jgi:PAS domain S-box-containing protein
LRAVLNAPAPVMLFDENGHILLLSRAWLKATGGFADDMRSIADWHATASVGEAQSVASFLRHAIEQEPIKQCGEFKFLSRTGRRHDWSLAVSALGPLSEGGRLFICIAHDVTEQRQAEARREDDALRFRQLLDALPAAIYTTDAEGRITYYNKAASDLWGHCPPLGTLWCGSLRLLWPDGRPMAIDQCPMATAIREGRPVRGLEAVAERPDGRRVAFLPFPTPLRNSAGELIGAVNMLIDITRRKRAERRLDLLAREVDHRTKNMLAVIQGLVHFTRAETVADFAAAIEGRVTALARVHSLLSDNQWDGVDLRILADQMFEPARANYRQRIGVEGDSVMLGAATAQSTALILHELMTNALKHGAMLSDTGRIDMSWTCDDDGRLSLSWSETGGPVILTPAVHGFGLTLIERTIVDQLDGQLRFDWRASGLVCWLQIPAMQDPFPAHANPSEDPTER